jgi:predicted nucleic acid-binding protein
VGDIAAVLRNHQLVGFDTSIFIYHIEESPHYAEVAATALKDLATGTFMGVTSALTLMEIAVQPLQMGRPEVADIYGALLNTFPNLTIANLDPFSARKAAELRATYRLRPADALQVAACVQRGATAFLTNDKTLRRVTEIEILLLDDFVDDSLTPIR